METEKGSQMRVRPLQKAHRPSRDGIDPVVRRPDEASPALVSVLPLALAV